METSSPAEDIRLTIAHFEALLKNRNLVAGSPWVEVCDHFMNLLRVALHFVEGNPSMAGSAEGDLRGAQFCRLARVGSAVAFSIEDSIKEENLV